MFQFDALNCEQFCSSRTSQQVASFHKGKMKRNGNRSTSTVQNNDFMHILTKETYPKELESQSISTIIKSQAQEISCARTVNKDSTRMWAP